MASYGNPAETLSDNSAIMQWLSNFQTMGGGAAKREEHSVPLRVRQDFFGSKGDRGIADTNFTNLHEFVGWERWVELFSH
jgi:hypothetical protein